MPGASTRLARGNGGKGIRGTGQSPAVVKNALEACKSVAQNSGISNNNNPNGEWITILPMTALQPGYEESRYHTFEVSEKVKRQIEGLGGVTHLKLNYYPDGGVARMKVHGYPSCHPSEKLSNAISDTATSTHNHTPRIHPHSSPNPPPSSQPYHHPELSSNTNGGIGLACSNKHYGVPSNLLRPHLGIDMGDGWETARHPNRPPVITKDPTTGLQDTELMDWSVVKLGSGGAKVDEGISRIIVDTRHFKGNFPESVTIDACYADPDEKNVVSDEDVCKSAGKEVKSQNGSIEWFPLLKRTLLTADAEHEFLREHGHNYIVNGRRGATHLRISITPDGGLSRVRIYGSPANVNKYVEKYVPPRSHL